MNIYASDFSYLSDFGDDTPAVCEALRRLSDGDVLILENRKYNFYPDYAAEKAYFVSNNAYSIKSCVFLLCGLNGVMVDGNGANLVFHGKMTPFIIDGCTDVKIADLSVDYSSPFFAQAEILESDEEHVILDFDESEVSCKVNDGNFCFYSEEDKWEESPSRALTLEFNSERRAPEINQPTYFTYTGKDKGEKFLNSLYRAVELKQLGKGRIGVYGRLGFSHTVGNTWVCTHNTGEYPGIFITGSKNTAVISVSIYHAPAMGIIAQSCENILLQGISVEIRKGSGRFLSVNADAVHFVSCRGRITICGCRFFNMLDDGMNVHGIYSFLRKAVDVNAAYFSVRRVHQQGITIFAVGDRVKITDSESGKETVLTVKSAENISRRYIRIEFLENITGISSDSIAENLTAYPEVYIDGCETGLNRPHGFLIGTQKKTVIENCVFSNMFSSVLIGGAAEEWYESGHAENVTVRNNIFNNSSYAGGSAIMVRHTPKNIEVNFRHKNIIIEHNTFIMPDRRFLAASSADGIVFRNNIFRHDTSLHAVRYNADSGVAVNDCTDTDISEPTEINIKKECTRK